MMTTKEVLNDTPFFIEWTKDVERLYGNDMEVMEMLRSITLYHNTLEGALEYLSHEIDMEWNIETATTLLNDIAEFLMLDI